MFSSGATCHSADCCFSEITLLNSKRVGLVQSDLSVITSNVACSRHDMAENCITYVLALIIN